MAEATADFLILVRNTTPMHRISTVKVEATPETTIAELKEQIDLPAEAFDLGRGGEIFKGTVTDCGITAGRRPCHILDMPKIELYLKEAKTEDKWERPAAASWSPPISCART